MDFPRSVFSYTDQAGITAPRTVASTHRASSWPLDASRVEPVVTVPAGRAVSGAPTDRTTRLIGWSVFALIVAITTALAVSSRYETRTLGERLDSTVSQVESVGQQAQTAVAEVAASAATVSTNAAAAVSEAVDDAAIQTRIVAAIVADPKLQSRKIDVKVNAGHVSLRGLAPSNADKDRAGSIASAVEGVTEVNNQLLVASASTGVVTRSEAPAPEPVVPQEPVPPTSQLPIDVPTVEPLPPRNTSSSQQIPEALIKSVDPSGRVWPETLAVA